LTLACLVQALRTCNMELLVNLWKVAVSFAAAKGLIQGFKEFSIKRK